MADDNSSGTGSPLRALAVFHDQGAGFWPWLFGRPGFRHCFVALNDGRAWIVIDPCSDGTRIDAEFAAEVDLVAHYRGQGFIVLETVVSRAGRRYTAPSGFTCVEAVKRILGVHGWWVWTPYQLYRCLEQSNGKHFQPSETKGNCATTAAADAGGPRHRSGAQARARGRQATPRQAGDDSDRHPG